MKLIEYLPLGGARVAMATAGSGVELASRAMNRFVG